MPSLSGTLIGELQGCSECRICSEHLNGQSDSSGEIDIIVELKFDLQKIGIHTIHGDQVRPTI